MVIRHSTSSSALDVRNSEEVLMIQEEDCSGNRYKMYLLGMGRKAGTSVRKLCEIIMAQD